MNWCRLIGVSLWQRLLERLTGRADRDLDRELRAHLDLEAEEQWEGGSSPDEAPFVARRIFGNTTLVKEDARAVWGWTSLERLEQDLRYAFRVLRKNTSFSVVAVLTLALGIGANSAIFSLFHALLLRSMPVRQPEQLVFLHQTLGGREMTDFTYGLYERFRDHNKVCDGLFAYMQRNDVSVLVNGQPELAAVQFVSADYFPVLGLEPFVGRVFASAEEHDRGKHPVAVLGYGYWRRRFGADPSTIGKQIVVNNVPFTIIGVTPRRFYGIAAGSAPDLTIPLAMVEQITERRFDERFSFWLQIIARLKPGISPEQGRSNLDVLYQQELQAALSTFPSAVRSLGAKLIANPKLDLRPAASGMDSPLRKQFTRPLQLLMVVVGLILLIACINLANLLLARSAVRHREIVVRLALGASRTRVVRQLLTESVLLSGIGGLLGWLLARQVGRLLVDSISTTTTPLTLDLSPNVPVVAFTCGTSVVCALLFGLAPAIRSTRLELIPSLKEVRIGLTSNSSRRTLGRLLVVGQIAMSLVLLIGAGLLVGSLQKLLRQDLGFDRDHILFFSLRTGLAGYDGPRAVVFYNSLLERLRGLPGVTTAAATNQRPLTQRSRNLVSVRGYQPRTELEMIPGVVRVDADYFRAIGIPLLRGRLFQPQDDSKAPRVAIISEAAARAWYSGKDPVGGRLGMGTAEHSGDMEVIGVVGNVKYDSLREQPPPVVYTPYLQDSPSGEMTIIIRTMGEPTGLAAVAQREVRALDSKLPLIHMMTMAVQVNELLARERLLAHISGFFSVLALLLAGIGLYGLMSYDVTRRTGEIGIRMALGAKRRDVIQMFLGETLALVLAGTVLGLAAALSAVRLIATLVFGISTTDPTTLIGTTALLITVAVIAVGLPAWRASRIDPMVALRFE
jgi:predicted permease